MFVANAYNFFYVIKNIFCIRKKTEKNGRIEKKEVGKREKGVGWGGEGKEFGIARKLKGESGEIVVKGDFIFMIA